MKHDYYIFRIEELSQILKKLGQVLVFQEDAKKVSDKDGIREAKRSTVQFAERVANIEPYLAYFWLSAIKEDTDITKNNKLKRLVSDAANAISKAWQRVLPGTIEEISDTFKLVPDISDQERFAYLPLYSFAIQIPFRLKKPYLSRDDNDFYILENPVRREKVFKVPMVTSTTWKGALRSALRQLGYKEDNEITVRLLGNPRKSEEAQAGRLYFYPTFFSNIGFEVINPHSYETGVGRGPILMECVPLNTIGILRIIYVPFGSPENEQERRVEVAGDMVVLAEGIKDMLVTYGFGAKTSNGYGVAEDNLASLGTLVIRAVLPEQQEHEFVLHNSLRITQKKFDSLTSLQNVAQETADALRKEDGVHE